MSGFTLIEMIFVVLVITILGTLSFMNVSDRREAERWEGTRERLVTLRNAIVGDENAIDNDGHRTNFGFHGDIGRLPTALQELVTNVNGLPAFNHSSAANVGLGWRGPYVTEMTTQSWDYNKDAWGQAYTYNLTKVPPEIASGGSDKTLGGGGAAFARDVVVKFPHEHTSATVWGFVLDGQKELNTQGVRVRYPVAGALANLNSTTNSVGVYSFTSVPFGVRSIQVTTTPTIAPKQFVVENRWTVVPSNVLNFFGVNQKVTYDTGSLGQVTPITATVSSTYQNTLTLDYITCWWTNNANAYIGAINMAGTTQTWGGGVCTSNTFNTRIDITSALALAANTASQTFNIVFKTNDCSTAAAAFASGSVITCKLEWTAGSNADPETITIPVP